jgi:hypothetical protein
MTALLYKVRAARTLTPKHFKLAVLLCLGIGRVSGSWVIASGELAGAAGCCRATVWRALDEFRRLGLIEATRTTRAGYKGWQKGAYDGLEWKFGPRLKRFFHNLLKPAVGRPDSNETPNTRCSTSLTPEVAGAAGENGRAARARFFDSLAAALGERMRALRFADRCTLHQIAAGLEQLPPGYEAAALHLARHAASAEGRTIAAPAAWIRQKLADMMRAVADPVPEGWRVRPTVMTKLIELQERLGVGLVQLVKPARQPRPRRKDAPFTTAGELAAAAIATPAPGASVVDKLRVEHQAEQARKQLARAAAITQDPEG